MSERIEKIIQRYKSPSQGENQKSKIDNQVLFAFDLSKITKKLGSYTKGLTNHSSFGIIAYGLQLSILF
jgi:hypothetical protein